MSHLKNAEGGMTAYPVDACKKERITKRLYAAMIEALFKQHLITASQQRELCQILKCGVLNAFDRR
jgi:hypothetical protein